MESTIFLKAQTQFRSLSVNWFTIQSLLLGYIKALKMISIAKVLSAKIFQSDSIRDECICLNHLLSILVESYPCISLKEFTSRELIRRKFMLFTFVNYLSTN